MLRIFKTTYRRDRKSMASLVSGYTLVEVLVSVAIFGILSMSIYQVFSSMTRAIRVYRENTSVSQLANQYLEIVHNLPYSQIGTINGNPSGNLPDLPNAVATVFNGNTYKIYYVVNYIDDPADGTIIAGTDSAPNDYKQIKLYIKNITSGLTQNFVTNIVPKGLESLGSGGALFIKVFNAVGQPVPNATVQITNTVLSPNINLTRTTDALGNWVEVGLPASSNSYHVVVTKTNYSTDQTYPTSVPNPNPIKGDATILAGQVTQISFSIDQLSSLTFNTMNQVCAAIPSIGLEVRGAKLIGTPNVLKFDTMYTSDASGKVSLPTLEWDNYTPGLTTPSYMVYGSSPVQQVNVLPNTNQGFNLILGPSTTNSLLVIVVDSLGNPIEGASVELQNASPAIDITKITGGSVWTAQSWSGGPGQVTLGNPTMYFVDDGNVGTSGIPSGLRLFNNGVTYAASGTLVSSTFDSGTSATSYTTLTWQPTSQDPTTTLKFQVAANNDNLTWNYAGPDGTGSSYYTVPGTTINAINNGNRYIRYKAFLSTTDTSKTPVLTSVNVNYVSGCFTPGQGIFSGLSAGAGYNLTVSLPGYTTQVINNLNVSGYQTQQVTLIP